MDPATWSVQPGRTHKHTRDSREWAPEAASPPAEPLPVEIEVPKLLPGFWLGDVLGQTERSANFKELFGDAALRLGDHADFALFTDVPRDRMAAVRAMQDPPDDPTLAPVWHLLDWAKRNNVRLLNVFEVFLAALPMGMPAQFLTEIAKQTPRGWGAAADILKAESATRFGGLVTDGDNRIRNVDVLQQVAESREAFALHLEGSDLNNSAYAAPPGHPFFVELQESHRANYERSQAELYGADYSDLPTEFFLSPRTAHFRHSIVLRNGPYTLPPVLQRFGYAKAFGRWDVPRITGVNMGHDLSWAEDDSESPKPMTRAQTLEFAKRVTHTLIRSLYNRSGDLRLTEAADAIRRHPQPALVWEAAIRFLAARDDLRELVSSVTLLRRLPDGTEERIPLPPTVSALFGPGIVVLLPVNDEGWWLGERPEPVRLLPYPTVDT